MHGNHLACLFILVLLAAPGVASGQTKEHQDAPNLPEQFLLPDDQLEKTAESLEQENDDSHFIDDLADLAAHPANINAANENELNSIPFLTPVQRKELLNYILTYGEVLSIFELQSIPGFDSLVISNIRPYVSITPQSHVPSPTLKNLIKFCNHDLLLRYGQSFPAGLGYPADDSALVLNPGTYYRGSPQKYYFRYTCSWFDKIRIGLAGEKDPGEQFFDGAQSAGMDFYAGYLSLNNIGVLKNLIIGNFRVAFGQGLTIGSGMSLGAVPGFSNSISIASGIRPNTGMNETSFLRGVAATVKIKHLECSGFGSYHTRDATAGNIDTSAASAETVSSFSSAGYHRTGAELSKRNMLSELVCGGNTSFSMAPNQQFGFKLGLTGIYYRYSKPVRPTLYPYNQFGFRGRENANFGFDVQVRYHGMYFFCEAGRSLNAAIAWIAGVTLAPDQRISLVIIYRNYGTEYQNPFSSAFGQSSLNSNERGIYTSVNAAVHPTLTLSGYIDLFAFPWLRYRVDAPSKGREFGAMTEWQATRTVRISARFYQKNTSVNAAVMPGSNMHKLAEYQCRNYRFSMEWLAAPWIRLKTRFEVKEAGTLEKSPEPGILVCQDAQITLPEMLKTITLRFALFDIPAYENRIYVYEPDVLYGYSVPAYQGRGIRACLVSKFCLIRQVDLWVRGGITYYTDRETVGTGLDMTEGNVRAEVTGQLLIRL